MFVCLICGEIDYKYVIELINYDSSLCAVCGICKGIYKLPEPEPIITTTIKPEPEPEPEPELEQIITTTIKPEPIITTTIKPEPKPKPKPKPKRKKIIYKSIQRKKTPPKKKITQHKKIMNPLYKKKLSEIDIYRLSKRLCHH